ncbi:SRPBCC domain-containing protein [Actinosynnema sp. NPDC020468]|uniref:SRPBCC family protein n=1 Tax=Actinosynnema sp. NPDC020468 TaxID=3154488 RepID=UPI003401D5A4
MGHAFEHVDEADLAVTPEQVWDAIATGPGIDSWFMGANEVEPGTAVRGAFLGYRPSHPITAWEPGKHLAYGGEKAPDGRFVAYEFLVEARDQGSTVLRVVTSGFLPGDDWEDEFEAMLAGGEMFRRTLVEYLTHFAGRHATPLTAAGPPLTPEVWARLGAALGLAGEPRPGDAVTVDGVPGVVYWANAKTVGIRTADALYRFFHGMPGVLLAMHHVFADDGRDAESWSRWMGGLG